MNYLHRFAFISAALVAIGFASIATAQDAPQNPSPEELEKLMEQYSKLGPQHKEFQRVVGKWNTVMKAYYENPEEPVVSEGTSTFRTIMGGRFLQEMFRSTYNGKPFQGYGITGYDNMKKKYASVWLDNMGTGIMTMQGDYDVKKHTLTETGTTASPLGEMKFRAVTHYVDEDHINFTMYMTGPDGKETKGMEVAYTRAKE
jgi:hypothetical protein